MKVEYLPSFLKDLKALKSTPSYSAIRNLVFQEIPNCSSFEEIRGLKKKIGSFVGSGESNRARMATDP